MLSAVARPSRKLFVKYRFNQMLLCDFMVLMWPTFGSNHSSCLSKQVAVYSPLAFSFFIYEQYSLKCLKKNFWNSFKKSTIFIVSPVSLSVAWTLLTIKYFYFMYLTIAAVLLPTATLEILEMSFGEARLALVVLLFYISFCSLNLKRNYPSTFLYAFEYFKRKARSVSIYLFVYFFCFSVMSWHCPFSSRKIPAFHWMMKLKTRPFSMWCVPQHRQQWNCMTKRSLTWTKVSVAVSLSDARIFKNTKWKFWHYSLDYWH